MPQYKYTAVNQDSQRMTGSLSATDENAARKELNELGLAILSIEETTAPAAPEAAPETAPPPPSAEPKPAQELKIKTETPQEPTPPAAPPTPEPKSEEEKKLAEKMLEKFEFEGIDKTGRKIIGTIPAANKLAAYTRLIKEYQFDIKYIAPNDASQAAKDHAKEEGVQELAAQMTATKDLTQVEKEKQEAVQNSGFKIKQEILLKKVDYVLEKIKQVLQKFDKEIKAENKKIIQGYVDKLLRIKNSTNLEYIEHTVEELLKKIQDQEIFLHKESLQKEKTELMIETQKMMSSLHTGSATSSKLKQDIEQKLSKIKIPIIKDLINKFKESIKEDPEVTSLKAQIKAVNSQIITYGKIWLRSWKDKEAKSQVAASIKAILPERKALITQLKTLKKQKKTKAVKAAPEEISKENIASSGANFIGWLLSFYLIYYFLAYYLTEKALPYKISFPWDTNIAHTPLIKYLVSILLLWYILLAIKTKFAAKKANVTPIIGVGGAVLTVLLLFNF